MEFQEDFLYHVYNQSNADFTLFRDADDYQLFLGKIERWITPNCDLLAYCLMPNHYHFMIQANKRSLKKRKLGMIGINELSNGLRLLQSQFAQEYNEKYHSRGSVFRPKVKSKLLDDESGNYVLNCFYYILQNPVKARLCQDAFGWEYSSAKSMLESTNSHLINKEVLMQYIDLDWDNFREEINQITTEERSQWML